MNHGTVSPEIAKGLIALSERIAAETASCSQQRVTLRLNKAPLQVSINAAP